MKKLPLLILPLLLLFAGQAWAGDRDSGDAHYCDCSDTGSNNLGTFAEPFKNISTINSHSFSTGEDLYFKAGTECNTGQGLSGRLFVDWGGSSSNAAVIGAYEDENDFVFEGGETKPILDGDDTEPNEFQGLIQCESDLDYVIVENLKVKNSNYTGVRVMYGDNWIIQDVETLNNHQSGVSLFYSADSVIQDVISTDDVDDRPNDGNTASILILDNWQDGASAGSVIRRCTVSGGWEGIGLYQTASNIIVEDCVVYDHDSYYIYVASGSHDNIIRRNLVYTSSGASKSRGITVGCENWTCGSRIADSSGKCADDNLVYDNMVANCSVGISLEAGGSDCVDNGYTPKGNIIANNTLVDNSKNFELCRVPTTASQNYAWNNISADYGSVSEMVDVNCSPGTGLEFDYNLWHETYAGAGANAQNNADPKLAKTSGWDSLVAGVVSASDFDINNDSAAIDNGKTPTTCSGKTGDQLTVGNTGYWIVGDTIYDDDGYSATVDSIDSDTTLTISGANKAQITSGDSLYYRAISSSEIDIGADEWVEPPQNSRPNAGTITVVESTSGDSTVAVDGDLNCDASPTDADGSQDIESYCWDVGNNGTCDATTEDADPITISGYVADDTITVCFTVEDRGGLSDSTCTNISVDTDGGQGDQTKVFGMNTGNDYAVGDDTMINQASATSNYDSNAFARAYESGDSSDRKILVSWDVSGLNETATSAKIRLFKKAGPYSGSQTVTAYLCEDSFVIDEATWNQYSDAGGSWTGGDHGQTTELGSVSVSSSDAAGTTYDITLSDLTALNAALNSGTYYVVLTIGGSYFDIYTEEETTYERAPELHVTYTDSEGAPDCNISLVTPNEGETATTGDTVRVAYACDQAITYTEVDAQDPISMETDEADLTLTIDSSDGATAFTHYFSDTVEAGDTSADLTLSANFTRTDDKLEYGGAGGTEIAYTYAEKALGIAIDTSAIDFSAGAFYHCNSSGTQIDTETTYTTGETCYVCVDSDGDYVWFNEGPLSNVKKGMSYGYPSDEQFWSYYDGISTGTLIFYHTVTAGERGTDIKSSDDGGSTYVITHGDTKLINHAGTEASSYAVAQQDPAGGNVIFSAPLSGANAVTVGSGGDYATMAAAKTALDHFLATDEFEALADTSEDFDWSSEPAFTYDGKGKAHTGHLNQNGQTVSRMRR